MTFVYQDYMDLITFEDSLVDMCLENSANSQRCTESVREVNPLEYEETQFSRSIQPQAFSLKTEEIEIESLNPSDSFNESLLLTEMKSVKNLDTCGNLSDNGIINSASVTGIPDSISPNGIPNGMPYSTSVTGIADSTSPNGMPYSTSELLQDAIEYMDMEMAYDRILKDDIGKIEGSEDTFDLGLGRQLSGNVALGMADVNILSPNHPTQKSVSDGEILIFQDNFKYQDLILNEGPSQYTYLGSSLDSQYPLTYVDIPSDQSFYVTSLDFMSQKPLSYLSQENNCKLTGTDMSTNQTFSTSTEELSDLNKDCLQSSEVSFGLDQTLPKSVEESTGSEQTILNSTEELFGLDHTYPKTDEESNELNQTLPKYSEELYGLNRTYPKTNEELYQPLSITLEDSMALDDSFSESTKNKFGMDETFPSSPEETLNPSSSFEGYYLLSSSCGYSSSDESCVSASSEEDANEGRGKLTNLKTFEKDWLKEIKVGKNKRPRGPKCWEYVLRLLKDERANPSLVKWEDPTSGSFRLVEKDRISAIWGSRPTKKRKDKVVKYESFARIIRYHYKKGAGKVLPVSENHLVYKFSDSVMKDFRAGKIL